jgi:hypothetical protein
MKAEIGKLEDEVSKLRTDNVMPSAARRGDKNNINKIIAEKRQLSMAHTSCDSDNKDLRRQLDELTAKYDELEQNFKEVCDEVVTEQENNTKLREKLKKARRSEHPASEPLDTYKLNQQINILRKENKNLINDITELRKENIRLTSELNNEQCKRIADELKTLTNDIFSTDIPEELDDEYIITRPPNFKGIYDVGKRNTSGRLDHVARIHIHEKDKKRFHTFHKLTTKLKPCTISELRLWQSLSDKCRFSMWFEIDGDTSESKLKERYGDRGVMSQIAPDIVPKRPAAVETGDGYHIASLLGRMLNMLSSMDEETFKKFFAFDDDSEDPNKKG